MARYTLKRKYFGVGDALGNVVGGTTEGVGKMLDSKPAALAGGLAGGATLGATLGTALSGLGGVASLASGPVGWLVGAGLGAAATRGLGKGLKSMGQDMQS